MRKMRGAVVAAMVGLGSVSGCAKSESNGGGSGKTGNAAVDEFVTAYCGAVRSCCMSAGFSTAVLDDCEESFSQLENFQRVIAGTVVFREPNRAECLEFIRDLARTCVVPEENPCRNLYQGTFPEGASCENAEQCSDGNYGVACVHIDDGENVGPGTCRAVTRASAGDTCFGGIDYDHFVTGYSTSDPDPSLGVCDRRDGLICNYDSYTCQPLTPAGAVCDGDSEHCADGHYCETTCVPRKSAGLPCEAFGECASDLACVDGTCAVRKFTDGDLCEGDYD